MKLHLLGLMVLSVSAFTQASENNQADFLKANKITFVTAGSQQGDIKKFTDEYKKIPAALREEMIKQGGSVLLINGDSVADDPNWNSENDESSEGVVAVGGEPFAQIPSRFVINKLNENQESVNIVLHEAAHALNSTYKKEGVSSAKAWTDLMKKYTADKAAIEELCSTYCDQGASEAFAEYFAQYYNSAPSRAKVELITPDIATFFKNLTSVKLENRVPHPPLEEITPDEESSGEDVVDNSADVQEEEQQFEEEQEEQQEEEETEGSSRTQRILRTSGKVGKQVVRGSVVVLRFLGRNIGAGLEFVGDKMQDVSQTK